MSFLENEQNKSPLYIYTLRDIEIHPFLYHKNGCISMSLSVNRFHSLKASAHDFG